MNSTNYMNITTWVKLTNLSVLRFVDTFLWLSSAIVHLTPDVWQLSEEHNTNNTMHNAGIRRAFDTWLISSTYSDELTIQQWVQSWMSGWGLALWGVCEVNTDIWHAIMQQVHATWPNRSGFSPKNTSSICQISPHISFSTVAWGASIHRRVRGDTDPSYDAHPYLKGVQATCGWPYVAPLGSSAHTASSVTHLLDISSNYCNMI